MSNAFPGIKRANILLLLAILLAVWIGWSAVAGASTEKSRFTHSACEDPNQAVCGAIVYGNGGGYVVKKTRLQAKGSQPDGAPLHTNCSEVSKSISADVAIDQYVVFVVPASCAYRLKISISGGNTKDKNLYLTPGCQITATSDGTTLNNNWNKLSVNWIKGKKQEGYPDKPVDPLGNKCGSLGKM